MQTEIKTTTTTGLQANYIPDGTLPIDEWGDMKQYRLPDGRIRLKYSYRGPAGPTKIKKTLSADTRVAEIVKEKGKLVETAERRSLKFSITRFEDIVDIVLRQNAGAGMRWVYERIRRELAGPVDTSFQVRYNRYVDLLESEEKALNTVSNHKGAIQRCLRTAFKRRMIDDIPVRDFGIRREFRDMVLTGDQRQALENVMIKNASHLYWSIRLAEVRPIRGRSDLWNLRKENYVRFGEGSPYLRLSARKTGLETTVPIADLPEVVEYLDRALPASCTLLFPRLNGAFTDVRDFDGMRRSSWYPMGNPRRHFGRLCRQANIVGFHFHDFKRLATTNMLENGYSAEDLMDLGFYASREMIDRCYKKRDAMTVLRRISVGPVVVPERMNLKEAL